MWTDVKKCHNQKLWAPYDDFIPDEATVEKQLLPYKRNNCKGAVTVASPCSESMPAGKKVACANRTACNTCHAKEAHKEDCTLNKGH